MTFLRRDIIRFGIVGSLAFLIDATVLAALVHGAAWRRKSHPSPLRVTRAGPPKAHKLSKSAT